MEGGVNLKLTMESGQPPHFTWRKEGNKYWRLIDGKRVEIWQAGDNVKVTPGYGWVARRLLRADDELGKVYARLIDDEHLAEAVSRYSGLRLTKSEAWETLVCYICSVNRNIPQIRKDVQKLMRADGWMMEPEEVADAKLPASLGFRAKYLSETARMVADGEVHLGRLNYLTYEQAKEQLMRLPGVGPKVADCVLLFAYGKDEAFPADVWVKRAMHKLYGVKGEKKISEYARKKWGLHAGYAQQYLFMYARDEMKARRGKKKLEGYEVMRKK